MHVYNHTNLFKIIKFKAIIQKLIQISLVLIESIISGIFSQKQLKDGHWI
jgi:hypothetical protein